MSAEDVRVVTDSLRAWLETGEPKWDLAREDLEFHDHDIMDAGEYRGRDGFAKWMADWSAAWSSFGMRVEEVIDVGDGCVVVLVRITATGAGSSARVERDDAIVYRLRDGLLARVDYFNDRAQARAQAGLAD